MTALLQDQAFIVRPARDEDSGGALAVLERVFAEYGFVFAVDAEMPEMRRVASAFAEKGGRFWVAADPDGTIVGIVGCAPAPATADPVARDGGGLELKRLYVHPDRRRRGIGEALVRVVEAEAIRQGCVRLDLWSDTRLPDGHRLYERCGFTRTGRLRDLNDLSQSIETYFWKPIG